MNLEHKFNGFESFSKLLSELPRSVENKVLQNAVNTAQREAAKDIRQIVPRDADGQSAASKKYGRGFKNIRVIRLRRVKPGQKAARIDTGNAFWLLIYEIGSRFQPARAWFAPAYRRLQEKIINTLGRTLGEGIEREAAKYRGGRK